ncbi:MAG: Flp family type IVb pilin [Desulfuromonadales bacterium]
MTSLVVDQLWRLLDEETAASAVEYAVLLALIIAVIFASIQVMGTRVEKGLNNFDKSFKP